MKQHTQNKQDEPNSIFYATDSKSNFRLLELVLSREGIILKHYEFAQLQDDESDLRREPLKTEEPLKTVEDACKHLRRKAARNVTDAYETIRADYRRPKDCIVVASGLYVHLKSLKQIVHISDKKLLDFVKSESGTPKNYEIMHCLAYIDSDAGTIQPRCFESGVEGTLAGVPRGNIEEPHERQYVRFFIPEGCNGKTLAELSFMEYRNWFVKNSGYAKEFADWFNSRNKRTL